MTSFSFSALQSAYKCRYLYKLKYIDGVKEPGLNSLALHFGTALHAGINALLEGDDASSFGLYWDSVKSLQFEKGRDTWEGLRDMGDTFLGRFEKLHMKHFKPHTMEVRLKATTPQGVDFEGTPDYVGGYMGKMTLLDFKTAGMAYLPEKLVVSDQLLLYAWLAEERLKVKIEQLAYLVFVKGREPRIQRLVAEMPSQEERDRRLANLSAQGMELLEAAKAGLFTKNHNACIEGARKCPYFDLCHGKKVVDGE